jgi:hypothetical protein
MQTKSGKAVQVHHFTLNARAKELLGEEHAEVISSLRLKRCATW